MMTQAQISGKTRRPWRILGIGGAGLLFVFLLLFAGVVVTLKMGVNSVFLATKIQDMLNERLGDRAHLTINSADLLLDDTFHLILESRDLALEVKDGNAQLDKIGHIRVGVAAMPLFQGKLQIREVHVSTISVTLPDRQGGNFFKKLPQDALGRIDFDALSHLVFNTFERGLELFEQQNLGRMSIAQIRVNFPLRTKRKQLEVTHLELTRANKELKLAGMGRFEGQEILLEGEAAQDATADRSMFSLHIAQMPLDLGAEEGVLPYWEDGTVKNGHFRIQGLSDLRLLGQKTGKEQSIALEAQLPQGKVALADVSDLPANAKLHLDHKIGRAGLWMTDAQLTLDRISVNLSGHFSPMEQPDPFASRGREDLLSDSQIIALLADATDIEGKYALELSIDQGSVVHPPHPKLDFWGKASGTLDALMRKVTFDRLALRTSAVEINGQGSLRFAPPEEGRLLIGQLTPEAIFDLQSPNLSMDEMSQLWPFNIASAARNWVLRQIVSGNLHQGKLHLNLPLDFYHKGKPRQPLGENELKISGALDQITANLVGDLPQLENFAAEFEIKGQEIALRQGHGEAFLDKANHPQTSLKVQNVTADITRAGQEPLKADLRFQIKGEGADMLRLISREPIKAGEKLPPGLKDFSGRLQAQMRLQFPIPETAAGGEAAKMSPDQIDWHGVIDFDKVALTLAFDSGGKITQAQGRAEIDKQHFSLTTQALLDEMAATITMSGATDKLAERDETISLTLDDEAQAKLFPALSPFISGTTLVEIGPERQGERAFHVDLRAAVVEVPWLGWKKGAGIGAQAQFTAIIDKNHSKNITIKDFNLQGDAFQLAGKIDIRDGSLARAHFHKASLNRGDDINLSVQFEGGRYVVKVSGKKFDMRSFIKSAGLSGSDSPTRSEAMSLELDIARVSGFYDEFFEHFKARFTQTHNGEETAELSALSARGSPLKATISRQQKKGLLRITSGDGGAILRFADYYDKIQGGALELELHLDESGAWRGPLTLRNFEIVNEPRLARIVTNSPPNGGKSLNEAIGGKINASQLYFDRAFGQIVRGENFLMLDRGIVRGPTIGATFQGVVYDAAGNVAMTGTFMPAYGLNRIFSNVPLLGNILGNGRDRGLIGITFKIDGKTKNPRIIVNPLSIIAPGVFRQIFEFHQ